MYQFVLVMHIIAAICIIALVLVQQGKGATIGSSFGAGASQTVFGSRGAGSFLLRLTLAFVFAFFATSIALNWLSAHAVKQTQVQSNQLPAGLLQPAPADTAILPPVEASVPAPVIAPLQTSVTPAVKQSAAPVKKETVTKKLNKVKSKKIEKKHNKKPHVSGQ